MVKDSGKKIAQEAWQREGMTQQAKQKVLSRVRIPAQFRWVQRISWIVPIVREKSAPLVEGIKAKLPQRFFRKVQNPALEESESVDTITFTPPISPGVDLIYRKYHCWHGNTLACEWTQKTLEADPTAYKCEKCGFPTILTAKTEFIGYRGRYSIENFLGHRGMGRLYQGFQVGDQQPVVVKEYLLPNVCFNPEETKVRKQLFERIAGLSLADGRIQDIRLNSPWDAISDPFAERCYLVSNGRQEAYPTLRSYLATNGAMTEAQVRRFLNQVLQTLQFLHTQKFSLPSGQIQQGIAHGNINLDSLLIIADDPAFFIHISDLSLWESVFDLPTSKTVIPTFAQDLIDVGYVAFYLLAGSIVAPVNHPLLYSNIEQEETRLSPEFKRFLLQLLNLNSSFSHAEEARQTLLKLPPAPLQAQEVLVFTSEPQEKKPNLRRFYLLFLGLFGLILLGTIISFLLQRFQNQQVTAKNVVVCCLKDVSAVPPGNYTFAGESNSTWTNIWQQENLVLQNQNLEQKLKINQPQLELNYQPADSLTEIISNIESGKIDFGIIDLFKQLSPQIRHERFAYDGLVVFVAFSYSKRDQSLPEALNGKITTEQLRDLYTGKITNWNQLPGLNLPDLPVKLYIPRNEPETLNIFAERVLKEENAIATFERLKNQEPPSSAFFANPTTSITTLPTLEMLRNVLQDFEGNDIGSIGFARFSQVFGQCSVYPLALGDGNQPAVQTLVLNNGNSINPKTDLCNDKGKYSPNIQVFQTGSYPLAYPLVVAYLGDNSRPPIGQKFAEMLKTEEVQQLLEKAGLVPLAKTQN